VSTNYTPTQAHDGSMSPDIAARLAAIDSGVAAVDTAAIAANALNLPYALARRTGALAETFSRLGQGIGNQAALVSGQLQFIAIPLLAGTTVSRITFEAGTTPLSGGNNQWFALWSFALAQLGITNDDTSTAWSASAEKGLNLVTPYVIPISSLYYLSCMVNAATPPSLMGIAANSGPASLAPMLGARDSTHTGLTNPASAPAPPTLSANGSYPWAWVS